jgi:hypothetical protein
MSHHSIWRRLFWRRSKRRSYFDGQHAMQAAIDKNGLRNPLIQPKTPAMEPTEQTKG